MHGILTVMIVLDKHYLEENPDVYEEVNKLVRQAYGMEEADEETTQENPESKENKKED